MAANKAMDAGDLMQVMGMLVRRARAAAASHELSLSESSVLARLGRQGPATAAELARGEGVKPQSMGTIVAALEDAGLVKRTPHPTDGRQMQVQLTAKGEALRNSVRDAKRSWMAQAVNRLDKKDQQTLFAAGEILRRIVEQGVE